MNLYRLDYLSPDGVATPVYDPLWPGNWLSRHASYARETAIRIAQETGAIVQVTRISGAGAMKPTLLASGETGRCHRPKG